MVNATDMVFVAFPVGPDLGQAVSVAESRSDFVLLRPTGSTKVEPYN